jgi:predicted AAA+ superfamily ATPase
MKFPRQLKARVEKALQVFPGVLITGARRTGKTTLSRELGGEYLTFDDINVYLSAKQDPSGFVRNLPSGKMIILDEIQRVPEIFT